MPFTGILTPFLVKRAGTGAARTTRGGTQRGGKTGRSGAAKGRQGAGRNSAANAPSSIWQFRDTLADNVSKPYVLTDDGDYNYLTFRIKVTPTGNTLSSQDILLALSSIRILASDTGDVVTMNACTTDFYDIAQRFIDFHKRPTVTSASGATATEATYILPITLPVARGPYTMIITTATVGTFAGGTSALSVLIELSCEIGTVFGRFRYVPTSLPFTPGANGINDLGPVCPIQDVDLAELFISGLTSNTADFLYVQMTNDNGVVGPNITPQMLVARANAEMSSTLQSTELFPLFAMKTDLKLGRSAHAYFFWGSSPSSSIRIAECWFD